MGGFVAVSRRRFEPFTGDISIEDSNEGGKGRERKVDSSSAEIRELLDVSTQQDMKGQDVWFVWTTGGRERIEQVSRVLISIELFMPEARNETHCGCPMDIFPT